jgi:hypothetical protein
MTNPDNERPQRFKPRNLVIFGGVATVLLGGVAFSLETGSWLGVGVIGALSLGGGMVLWMLKIGGVFDPVEPPASPPAESAATSAPPPDAPAP